MNIPNDPVILLSYINTQLRDFYESLEDLCLSLNLDETLLQDKLASIDYYYDAATNRFL
ncbi:MAG: hypothetical protein PWP24_620 [Clostridiales bacterium]|nr:hypothetical protein [Clostridiales bacterium]